MQVPLPLEWWFLLSTSLILFSYLQQTPTSLSQHIQNGQDRYCLLLHVRPHWQAGRRREKGRGEVRRDRRHLPGPGDSARRGARQDVRGAQGLLHPRALGPQGPRGLRRLPVRHPHALRQLPGPVEDLHRPHRRPVGFGRARRQDGRPVRLDGRPGRRPGIDVPGGHVDAGPPRHDLRAARLLQDLCPADLARRGPRRLALGRRHVCFVGWLAPAVGSRARDCRDPGRVVWCYRRQALWLTAWQPG